MYQPIANSRSKRIARSLTALGLVTALSPAALARDFYVDPDLAVDPDNYECTKANPCGTIRWAVDFSNDGDTIIARGEFEFYQAIEIDHSLTIRGADSDVVLDAQELDRHFTVDAVGGEVTLENLVMVGGLGHAGSPAGVADGGSVLVLAGALTVEEVEFTNNRSEGNGGAIACRYPDLDEACTGVTARNSVFESNRAGSVEDGSVVDAAMGGAVYSYATTEVYDSMFTDNDASYSGGAIYSGIVFDAPLTVVDSEFVENSTLGGGGALYSLGGTSTIRRCSFHANQATFGGAVSGQLGTAKNVNECETLCVG
jgi:predicted outer membrane repeat protein